MHEADPDDIIIEGYQEIAGSGVQALVNKRPVRIGSSAFVSPLASSRETGIHIGFDGNLRGRFIVSNSYREGIKVWPKISRQRVTMFTCLVET